MNRIILLLAAPFIFFTAQADQITQKEADNIVLERMNQETRQYTIYAKDGVQQKWTITSVDGEVFEVNYFFWIYYIDYTDNTGKFLLVKESNGNLLEVNVKGDAKPEDLEEWRIVEAMQISLVNTKWKLEGIVDVETEILTELGHKECYECYTITFRPDSTFIGTMGHCKIIFWNYEVDYKTGVLLIPNNGKDAGCDLPESQEERLYLQILLEIQSFIVNKYPRILHLYYNDAKNYLKYKEIGGDINGY